MNIKLPNYEIMENLFTTKSIFRLLIKWKYHLAVLIAMAAVLSIVLSSPVFIEPKFESSAIIYPASHVTFSDESETEQMIEILASTDIMFKIIDAFDLIEHYGYDKNERHLIHKITRDFKKNVRFNKTSYEAIEIVVRDKDPFIAAAIADSIISFYNQKVLDLNKEKSKELVVIYRHEMKKKEKEVDSLAKEITKIRENYGILHLSSQVERLTEAIYQGRAIAGAHKVLEGWKKAGADYHRLDSLFSFALYDYNKLKSHYEAAVRDTIKIQTYSHVISKPFPTDKKSYPVRWVIVMFSVFGVFLISIIIIAIIDSRNIKNE